MATGARVPAVVAVSLVLTAPATVATTASHEHIPAIMRMDYEVGDLSAAVHSRRTLVGKRSLVFTFRGNDEHARDLARQGFVVVQVSDRLSLDGHRELWHRLSAGTGPLAERFRGFAGHVAVPRP